MGCWPSGHPGQNNWGNQTQGQAPSAACSALTLLGCPMPTRRDVLGFPAAAGLNRSLSLIICRPAAPLTPAATCRSVFGRQSSSEQCRKMAVSDAPAGPLTRQSHAGCLSVHACCCTGCLANRGLGGLEPGTTNACCMFVCWSLHACQRGACRSVMLPAMRG